MINGCNLQQRFSLIWQHDCARRSPISQKVLIVDRKDEIRALTYIASSWDQSWKDDMRHKIPITDQKKKKNMKTMLWQTLPALGNSHVQKTRLTKYSSPIESRKTKCRQMLAAVEPGQVKTLSITLDGPFAPRTSWTTFPDYSWAVWSVLLLPRSFLADRNLKLANILRSLLRILFRVLQEATAGKPISPLSDGDEVLTSTMMKSQLRCHSFHGA